MYRKVRIISDRWKSFFALPANGIYILSCLSLLTLFTGCSTNPLKHAPRYRPGLQQDIYNASLRQAEEAHSLKQASQEAYVYRIHPTDVLEITVYDYDKMNLVTRVGIGGKINFPPLGEIQAAGLTQAELETAIDNGLKGAYLKEPKVIVSVKEATSQNITILGEVRTPGQQAVWGQTSLLDVLAKAGGVTEKANRIAYLARPIAQDSLAASSTLTTQSLPTNAATSSATSGIKTFQIYLAALLRNGDEVWNVPVEPGDTITVPPAGSVHVTGPYIEKPGSYPLSFTPTTMREMIDTAGGLKWGASRDIILSRNSANGKTEFSKVNFNQALRQSQYDVIMEPGDRLIVVSSPWRHAVDLFRRGLLTLTATFRATDTTTVGVGTNALFVK